MHWVRHLKSSTVETKSLLSRNSHAGHSILIYGSTQIRYFWLNWFKRRCFYVLKGIRVRYMKRKTFELDLISNCVTLIKSIFCRCWNIQIFARYFGWEWPLMSAWIWQDTSISWTITESHKPPSGKFNLVPAQTRKKGVFGYVRTTPDRSMCQNRNADMGQVVQSWVKISQG